MSVRFILPIESSCLSSRAGVQTKGNHNPPCPLLVGFQYWDPSNHSETGSVDFPLLVPDWGEGDLDDDPELRQPAKSQDAHMQMVQMVQMVKDLGMKLRRI